MKVQKQSNPPLLGLKLAAKVNKSHAMPVYVLGFVPLGWSLMSALPSCLPMHSEFCLESENSHHISTLKGREEYYYFVHLFVSFSPIYFYHVFFIKRPLMQQCIFEVEYAENQ